MKSIDEIREFFKNDRYAAAAGCRIDEVGDKYAKCSLTLTDVHKNAVGGVMGGVHYTLADFTFAVATNWQTPGVVSLSCTINYLGAVKGERLIAEAKCVKDGRATCNYIVDIYDDTAHPVAQVSMTGFHTENR